MKISKRKPTCLLRHHFRPITLFMYVLTGYMVLWVIFVKGKHDHHVWKPISHDDKLHKQSFTKYHHRLLTNAEVSSKKIDFQNDEREAFEQNTSTKSEEVRFPKRVMENCTSGLTVKDRPMSKQNRYIETMNVSKLSVTKQDIVNHTITKEYFKTHGESLDYLVNQHRFKFSLLPRVCEKSSNLDFIIIVHTAIYHYWRRKNLRQSLLASKNIQFTFRLAFLVGMTKNSKHQKQLRKEFTKYGDLVQGNFVDSYQNLTYKHIMGYHWVIHYCNEAKYVIKIDDDVILNLQNVYQYVVEVTVPDGYIACSAFRKSKIKQKGKWSSVRSQFPFTRYPPYCSGFAYLAPMSVVQRLYDDSSNVRFFWIDDVYVTGLLTLSAGVELQGLSRTQAYKHLDKTPIPEVIAKDALFIFHDPKYIIQ